jgi:nitrogen regulatory protein P-II 1
MKEIRAIVRPNRLSRLRDALRAIPNFPGVTIFKADELTDFTEKLMLCVLVEDDMVEPIRLAILEACHTGQIGDGLVWVVNIESMHRIRDQHVIK